MQNQEADHMYTVKEVAELLGVSVHTVRYYDDRGLNPRTKRNSANQRLFDDMEVEWLFVSLTLKNTGLSLKDVKHYIELYQQGDSTLPERYELMRKQREKTLQEMEELKLRLAVRAEAGRGWRKRLELRAGFSFRYRWM